MKSIIIMVLLCYRGYYLICVVIVLGLIAPRYLTEENLAGRQLDDRGRNCTVPPGYEHRAAFRWLK